MAETPDDDEPPLDDEPLDEDDSGDTVVPAVGTQPLPFQLHHRPAPFCCQIVPPT